MHKNIEQRPTIQERDNDSWEMISTGLFAIAAVALGYLVATGFDSTQPPRPIADGTSIGGTTGQHR